MSLDCLHPDGRSRLTLESRRRGWLWLYLIIINSEAKMRSHQNSTKDDDPVWWSNSNQFQSCASPLLSSLLSPLCPAFWGWIFFLHPTLYLTPCVALCILLVQSVRRWYCLCVGTYKSSYFISVLISLIYFNYSLQFTIIKISQTCWLLALSKQGAPKNNLECRRLWQNLSTIKYVQSTFLLRDWLSHSRRDIKIIIVKLTSFEEPGMPKISWQTF